ncbi:AAA domain-containing protein [Nocardia sp. NPDC050406]|uniref:AAA domain-containing protein n=1 Tax=Nocardia sp. NPDC050406 TaxID=3364318 RepID=UPI003787EFB0
MILFGDRVVCSTGDLVEAARCEFALLRALDAGLGLVAPVAYQSPGVLPRPADDAREHRLADLRDRHGDTVVRIRLPHATPTDPAQPEPAPPQHPSATRHSDPAGHTPGDPAPHSGAAPSDDPTQRRDGSAARQSVSTTVADPMRDGDPARDSRSTPEPSRAPSAGMRDDDVMREGGPARDSRSTPDASGARGGGVRATDPARDSDLTREAGAAEFATAAALSDPEEIVAALAVAHEQTVAALRGGAEAIAGPVLFDGAFAVSCDFLLRDGAPETHDYLTAGLAGRRGRITALLEQAAFADVLGRNGFRAAPHGRLWVEGGTVDQPLADIAIVYRARRERLEMILEAKLNELLPVQWGDRRFLACGQCAACTAELESRRDLLLVAGMRPAVRAQLRDAGITTVDRLAAADVTVSGVPAPTFTALRRQAELQLHREHTGHPIYTVFDAAALSGLPAPTPGDLFVSVTTPGGQPSPDLLVTIGSGEPENIFRGFMIRDAADRQRGESPAAQQVSVDDQAIALLDFLAEWQWNHPGLRIHHYRGGLRALLTDLAEPHPDGEDIVAALLPLLVDLYPIVRAALLVGERSYALPHLPPNQFGPNEFDDAWPADEDESTPLDRPAPDHRPTPLPSHGGTAVAVLDHAVRTEDDDNRMAALADLDPAALAELHAAALAKLDLAAETPAHPSEASDSTALTETGSATAATPDSPDDEPEIDNALREFVGDWVAVARLRDWLLELAEAHDIRPLGRPDPSVAEPPPAAIEAALREFANAETTGATPRSEDGQELYTSPRQRDEARLAAAMTAAALGYHRRERQPLRWAHADRLDLPVEEWADTPGVLIADWGTVDTDWHTTIQRPMRRYLTLTGRLGTGNAPPPGTPVVTLYDRPARDLPAMPGRRALARATVLGCALDTNFDDVVRVVEFLPEGCDPYDELPSAIAPFPPSRQDWLEDAIEEVAHDLLVTLPEVPRTATFDLLCRRPPRLATGQVLPEVFGDHAAAVTAAVLDLDDSYIAIQGPPGTGKTDTAARVVERLVTRYKWRVGVVARSHKAVEHLLDAVVRVGVLPELVAKSEAQTVAPEWLGIDADRYERFLDNAVNGCVVGGLPDDFVDPQRIPRESLDLLVVADAGRFPLADTVAVTVSARNLLLVGDPAPATGHGAHPAPVGEAALGWLVGPHRTLPADYGYFLDRTWRMHPRMCGPVSRLRYDNRLRSNETVTLARELDGVPPGVRTITVEHHNNATESAEEAREVVRQVRTLLGLPWHTGAVTRRLHPHDILVVAPYHAQVARIRTLLSRARIEDVLVGTPDHFQGREAAVVLVSMTTSAPKDAPHGVAPLVSRHWLTSAISRAMWSAMIIRSPLLTEYLPTGTAELADLAAFLQLDRV